MGCSSSRSTQEHVPISNRNLPIINDNEKIILKVKLQRDKIMMQRNDLQRKSDSNLEKIKILVKAKKKDEAVYLLMKKRNLDSSLKNVSIKLDFVESRIQKIENVQDEAEFTHIIAESNDVLKNLMDQVNINAVKEAQELDQIVNLQNENVLNIIRQGENDKAILLEYDKLGESTTFGNIQEKIQSDVKMKEPQVYSKDVRKMDFA